MRGILFLFVLVIFGLGSTVKSNASEREPLSESDVFHANIQLRVAERADLTCKRGYKIQTSDGFVVLAKCEKDNNFFAALFQVSRNFETWTLVQVIPIADKR